MGYRSRCFSNSVVDCVGLRERMLIGVTYTLATTACWRERSVCVCVRGVTDCSGVIPSRGTGSCDRQLVINTDTRPPLADCSVRDELGSTCAQPA